eukprot:gene25318-biopygen16490
MMRRDRVPTDSSPSPRKGSPAHHCIGPAETELRKGEARGAPTGQPDASAAQEARATRTPKWGGDQLKVPLAAAQNKEG